MNVLVDGVVFARQRYGGVSRVWVEILRRFRSQNVNVTLLVPHRVKQWLAEENIHSGQHYSLKLDFLYWPARIFDRVSTRSTVNKIQALDKGIQIFHSSLNSTVFTKKVKKVVTIHDMIPELYQQEYGTKWTPLLLETRRAVLANADLIITVSNTTRSDVLNLYPWIDETRVKVIYSGPPTMQQYSEDASSANLPILDSTNLPGQFFLYVGSRDHYKNFRLLVELVKTLPEHKTTSFVCAGQPAKRETLKTLDNLGVLKNFTFTGHINDGQLVALYNKAIALVCPSLYEGFGLPILEALALGCPVVCSNIEVFREVAEGNAVFFLPNSPESLSEAMTRVAVDRNAYGDSGKKRAAEFSWDKTVQELVRHYHDLL